MAKATLPQSATEVYTLYKLLFPNGKLYWGITKNTANDRWLEHQHKARRGVRFPVYTELTG
jgi:predicted GIY-YIG superfamily endonuclease